MRFFCIHLLSSRGGGVTFVPETHRVANNARGSPFSIISQKLEQRPAYAQHKERNLDHGHYCNQHKMLLVKPDL